MIPHRCFLPAMLLTVLLTVAATAEDTSPSARPNIVFIMADDHAAHAVSAYGSRINRTPNIDRLAREGMLFENCFALSGIEEGARVGGLVQS